MKYILIIMGFLLFSGIDSSYGQIISCDARLKSQSPHDLVIQMAPNSVVNEVFAQIEFYSDSTKTVRADIIVPKSDYMAKFDIGSNVSAVNVKSVTIFVSGQVQGQYFNTTKLCYLSTSN